MNLIEYASPAKTYLDLIDPKDPKGKKLIGLRVYGYTLDSDQFELLNEEIFQKSSEDSSLIVDKKQPDEIKLPTDPDGAKKRKELSTKLIYNIEGATDWEYSEEARDELMANPRYRWISEQWQKHLDDRGEWQAPDESSLSSGANVSPGSMDTRTEQELSSQS